MQLLILRMDQSILVSQPKSSGMFQNLNTYYTIKYRINGITSFFSN